MTTGNKQNPLLYLFSKTWRYSENNRKNIILFWLMFVIAQSISTFIRPLVVAKVIDVLSKQGINNGSIKILVFLVLLVVIRPMVFWMFHGPARVMERTNAFMAKINYRRYLLKGVMTMPIEWHTEHHSGDTIDKIEKGTTGLYDFSSNSYDNIYGIVQLIGSCVMLVYISHTAIWIVLVIMAISTYITMRFDKVLIPQYHSLNKTENQISESVFDVISNISTVIILRVEKLVFKAIVHKIEKPVELFRKNARLSELKWFLTSFCTNTMSGAVLAMFIWQHFGAGPGTVTGSAYILINYVDQIAEILFQFTGAYSEVIRQKTRVVNSEELTTDFKTENFTNHILPTDWKKLEVTGLSFSYNKGDTEPNLNNISFAINRGERVALIGETGSGKTTFLKIVRDLYHPQESTLMVDGQMVPNGFEGISRAITLVQQNPEIFARTIWENVTMGAEYDKDFVLQFTDMACFTDVVECLPKGFESSIKEKGVNLSGGQQQRLALSRGLLACHDKDIVLLDEPTSSLDTITGIAIYQNIFRGFKEKTIISTVHQLQLLPFFDRICIFDNGQIIAFGTLTELLTSCPKFISLWETMQKTTVRNQIV